MDVRWWIGILESTEDPDNLGRVRIRIPGIHTDYTGDDRLDEGIGIKTEQLPFCIVSTPLIYSGTIPPPQCQVGNWILGISLDGDNYQKLIALGIIRGEYCAEALGDGSSADPDQMEEPQPIQNQCYDKYYSALDSISTSGAMESNKSALQDGGERFKDAMAEMKANNPDQYSKVSQASGLDVNTNGNNAEVANNADANRIYGRTMFDQMMSAMGENPVMAALAFKVGVDKATQLRDTYSGQSKTYAEMIKNLKSSGNENEALYMENFIKAVGDGACLGAEPTNQIPEGSGDASVYLSIMARNANSAKGYNQSKRELDNYYDCSSFVCRALKEAGYNVPTPSFTTHNIGSYLTKIGFKEYKINVNSTNCNSVCKPGDILWTSGHVETFYGNGQMVGAHSTASGVSIKKFWGNYSIIYRLG